MNLGGWIIAAAFLLGATPGCMRTREAAALDSAVPDESAEEIRAAASGGPGSVGLEPGVSRHMASRRSVEIAGVGYELYFTIGSGEPVKGRVDISFDLRSLEAPLVIDFAGKEVGDVSSTGKPIPFLFEKEHIVVPSESLRLGSNVLTIRFVPDERPLHREDDYLYTLFVPERARLVFPCFDQPDIKAEFDLTLKLPAGWIGVSNTEVRQYEETEGGGTVVSFSETEPISTYLFSFAAGRFKVETAERGGRVMNLYHLEPDTAKVGRSAGSIFDLHAEALRWMEEYTGIEYPFGKFDFIALPAFPYSGMEHPGAILYRAERLFLDESATERERLRRAGVISHETAHMWFGDLVTMRWFDDVWLKEAFAQFMSDRIIRPAFPGVDHRLLFISSHHDPLNDVERTSGTNAIRQELGNLNEAGSVYGDIIYHKPPLMLNQLEALMGEDGLREALRTYLSDYRYGNATWEELVSILDLYCPEDLAFWSDAWVMERGRPVISMSPVREDSGMRSAVEEEEPQGSAAAAAHAPLRIKQEDPMGRGLVWVQQYTIAVCTPKGVREIPVRLDAEEIIVGDEVQENAFILPDSRGDGFGRFETDWGKAGTFDRGMDFQLDPVQRAMLARLARDNFLEGSLGDEYMRLIHSLFVSEEVELNLQAMLNYLVEGYWLFVPEELRAAWASVLEESILEKMRNVPTASAKSACFEAFRSVATTDGGVETLLKVWDEDLEFEGLPFSERDYCAMALELAVREVPGWRDILDRQAERITDPELGRRYAFIRGAVDSERAQRDRFFASLEEAENRRHEPWVLEALYYLHHPLRTASSIRYISRSLGLLEEIRATGDIFFPRDWIKATLRYHRSDEAMLSVERFLLENNGYPSKLVSIILQAADIPSRANRYSRL
jgi:aminopeptidase N